MFFYYIIYNRINPFVLKLTKKKKITSLVLIVLLFYFYTRKIIFK